MINFKFFFSSQGTAKILKEAIATALASALLLHYTPPAEATAVTTDRLEETLMNPDASARPRVWWHWMDGNVTKDGIAKDLAWMKRIGIGGVQYFDGSLHTPQIVSTRVPYLSPAWRSTFRYAVTESEAADLEFTIASSPGWSQTGGPWVRPEQAMKKLVWSELDVSGGQPIVVPLPHPPDTTGPFQNIPGGGAEPSQPPPQGLPTLYRDSRIIAYRIPETDENLPAKITSSSPIDPTRLTDGNRTHFQQLASRADQPGWINFAYPEPVTMRAVELVLQPGARIGPIYPSWPVGRIEASDDGLIYRKVADLPERGAPQQTVAFSAATARHFRLLLEPRFAPFPVKAFAPPETSIPAHGVARVKFISEARVNRFEDKGGWSTVSGLGEVRTPIAAENATIPTGSVVDITDRFQPDGILSWTPPVGKWRILRLGWSLTGKLNNPASKEGTGLEVDKLNRVHVKAYTTAYLNHYEQAVGQSNMGSRGIRYMLNDSYEALAANWTDDILVEFQRRRGYAPMPWLPVLTGRVVESADKSDRFLWDFRRTLADLIADEHYGILSTELRSRGMGRYGESHEALRAFVGDGMEVKKTADIPMGATWAIQSTNKQLPDIRESASVSHIYGQNIVAAESFTSLFPAYGFDPAALKPFADKMMANGVNQFVIHTSVHQPTEVEGPGIGLGSVGQWFTRKETWSEMARPWVDYLARSSNLLQQGQFVADIAFFYGEDDNITAMYDNNNPALPPGYAFDFVNADAIRSVFQMDNDRLVSPSGSAYRLLAFDPNVQRVTVPTLRKLDALSKAGLVIAGPKPISSPSLADNDLEFSALVDAIWSRVGQTFSTVEAAIDALELAPDASLGSESLSFVHRKLPNADLYFIANLSDTSVASTASFRIKGMAPEIWRADDGTVSAASYDFVDDRTNVPMTIEGHDAVFVVFRRPTTLPSRRIPSTPRSPFMTLDGPWQITFPPNRGAPSSTTFQTLRSWTAIDVAGIRYFSGTARYSKTLSIPDLPKEGSLILDLGQVSNIAQVFVNGHAAGIAWKSPFRVDVSNFVYKGDNRIEIVVSNLWPNRMIGDKQVGGIHRYAMATYDPFTMNTPLLPSGLLGPVQLYIDMDLP